MPEQEPQVGQALRSMASTLASADRIIGGGDDRVDEIERALLSGEDDLAGLHRSAGDEHRGDVESQRRHQHAGRDLVAIGNAHQRVGAMGVDHIFDAVGDKVARGQGVEHPVVAHGDAVVDGDRVEFLRDAAGLLDFARDELAKVLQMHMAGDELRETVGDGDDRLAEILVLHARGAPQPSRAGHIATVGRGAGTIGRHGGLVSSVDRSLERFDVRTSAWRPAEQWRPMFSVWPGWRREGAERASSRQARCAASLALSE